MRRVEEASSLLVLENKRQDAASTLHFETETIRCLAPSYQVMEINPGDARAYYNRGNA
ncbi:MAG: hypothetical protein NTX88_10810 [Candidatus Atribacteria bacterium]|nr:hypothetical protein [Candidatus Atribacteria bacterium]